MQSQSNPKEYDAVLGGHSVIPASAAVLGGVQGAITRLEKELEVESLQRVKFDVLIHTKARMYAFDEDCRPMTAIAREMLNPLLPRLLETDLARDISSPLLLLLWELDKSNPEKVKVFSTRVATFKLTELFGVTWYATITKCNINQLLTTYIPSREEVEQWCPGLAYH